MSHIATRPPCPLPATNLHLSDWSPTALTPIALKPDGPRIWAKLEFMNPGGSTKDRIARHILTKAYINGHVQTGDTVVEASSGSTSIAMAMVCAQLGLRFIAVMPAGVSNERSMIIQAYGAEVHHMESDASMVECIAEARSLAEIRGAFFPAQFENPENAAAHRYGTAREIIQQLPTPHVDAVVAGIGTGGTLVGLYQGMLDHACSARPVVARPVAATSNGQLAPGCFDHAECCSSYSNRIPGVVENLSLLFQPEEFDDLHTVEITDDHAIETTRKLIQHGFPVGPSSGLNYAAAEQTYMQLNELGIESPIVVTVFCDRMERYFSTELFRCNHSYEASTL